jgi:hemerythrin-like domain-containing protein
MSKVTEAIHNHHAKMMRTFGDLAHAWGDNRTVENTGALLNFLKGELLPHANAEERNLYPAIGRLIRAHGTGTETMSVDHEFIASYARQIDEVAEALERATGEDRQILAARIERLVLELRALVTVHLAKEERVLMPMLERYSSEKEQQEALEQMHADFVAEKNAALGGKA